MANELQGVRVAFVVANEGIEEAELLEPRRAVDPHRGGPVAGRGGTSWPCLQTDLRNAGAGSRATYAPSAASSWRPSPRPRWLCDR